MFHGESGIDSLLETQPSFPEDKSDLAKEVTQKIVTSRGSLILDQPFFGYILTHLTIFPTKENIKKFATDGNYLYFDTSYIGDLIRNNSNWKGKIKGMLIHLLMHLIFRHNKRGKGKIPVIWAFACDIAVFQLLLDIKDDWKTPEDWDLIDLREIPQELTGNNAETIYQKLLEILKSEDDGSETDSIRGEDNGYNKNNETGLNDRFDQQMIQLQDFEKLETYQCDIEKVALQSPVNEVDEEYMDQYFQGIIRSAYEKQKEFGDLPADLDRYISRTLYPKVNWRVTLTKYLQNAIVHDLSWRHPNKRLFGQGYLLPGLLKENVTILFGIDTSGSVSDEVLSHILTEAQQILNTIANTLMILVDCDAKIQQIRTYMPGEPINEKRFIGGGGTDFRPVFKLIEKYTPDVIIYCTDGVGQYPAKSDIPCIWVLTTNATPPFGEIIRIDV